jgi:peptidoglycan/LPS O-acetylase OafA/YrhL
MFTLDRSKNDTSITLDLLRAIAAQMVCVGHAINFGRLGSTNAPSYGVLLFFVLSGFVIAHTLKSKSRTPDYSLSKYSVERFCRIYIAYAPCLLLIGMLQVWADWSGLNFGSIDSTWRTFFANLIMLQMYPMIPSFGSFGVAGQLSTISLEFHIYFFVGSLYFLFVGRQRVLCAIVAIISARMPLAYFIANDDGRALFGLWLMGFAAYFLLISVTIDLSLAAMFAITTAGIIHWWLPFLDLKNAYSIANFPALTLVFTAVVIITQCYRFLSKTLIAEKIIHFFAGYSLTLYLLHLSIIRTIFAVFPDPSSTEMLVSIVLANVLSACLAFSAMGEIHYRKLAALVFQFIFKRTSPSA